MDQLTSAEAQDELGPSIPTAGNVSSRWGILAVAAVFCFFLTVYGFSSRADVQVSDEAATLAEQLNDRLGGALPTEQAPQPDAPKFGAQ